MSSTEYKVVLRAKLPEVSNDSEHLAWMRKHVGEPEELDEWSNGLWFTYAKRKFDAPYLKECFGGGVFGVELVLVDSVEEPVELVVSVEELMSHVERLRGLVGSSPVKLVSYSWYNGVDEPVVW